MFANRFTAVIDACVLAPALSRNLILQLSAAEFFRVRWSLRLMEETEKAIVRILGDRPSANTDACRACKAMNEAFEDAIVTGYEVLEPGLLGLPDPDDVHVVAAAIETGASVIVTENIRDFPSAVTRPHGIEVKTADDFVADAINLDQSRAVEAIRRMRLRLTKPARSPEDLLLLMERRGLTATADALRPHRTFL